MTNQQRMDRLNDVRERIANYMTSGGLFNPELADHIAVRDLLIDIDTVLLHCHTGLADTQQQTGPQP